ncbi:hypothetical protein Lal_00008028 [Lupinus albus]|nr:hypothetical protein Lal_00008028 [Lupinus albus]
MKTMAKRQRPMEVDGSSPVAGGRTATRRDPYYYPTLQATRLAKFQGRRLTYIDISWLVEQGFEFPHQMELQVGGKLIMLDEKLFLDIGGLTSFKYPYGRFETALWNAFEYIKEYRKDINFEIECDESTDEDTKDEGDVSWT